MLNNVFHPRKSFLLWDNMDRYSTTRHTTDINIIWRMRFASRITRATDTRAACLVLIAFPLRQCLSERASTFRYTYIACLVLSATSPETVKSVCCASYPASTSYSLLWDNLILCQRLFLLLLCTFQIPGTYQACFPARKENPGQLSRYSDLGYGLDGQEFVSWQGKKFYFFKTSIPVLESTHPLI